MTAVSALLKQLSPVESQLLQLEVEVRVCVGIGFTVRRKNLRMDEPPPITSTAICLVPVGVEAEVEMVRVDVQVGLQDVGEKEAVAPAGRPDAVKDTDWVVPNVRVAVQVLVTEEP